jgi:sulfatase maturation enzyme AslB (radical SAM superfamily)
MFCTQPFNHIDIIVENDQVLLQPCNTWHIKKKFSIAEYKDNIEELRTTLKHTYHHAGCRDCIKNDKMKIRSRRVVQNEFSEDNNLSTDRIQSLGVRYGTLCNSKCMTCTHMRSSSWVADAEKLGLHIDDKYRFKKNLLPGVDVFFDNFDLDDLRYVEFHGGEPLMQSYPYEFLKKVKKLDQLVVKVNTNLTVMPSPELEELLKKCKRVDFLLSVDDIGPRYDMLRFPGKWDTFVNNMETLKQRGYRTMAFNVLSSLNIFYAVEFYKWAVKNFGNEVHSQYVVDISHMDISYLPQHAKDRVLERIADYKGKLFDSIRTKLNDKNEDLVDDLKKYIIDLDGIRNTNYPGTFSEWWDILTEKTPN